MSKLRLSLVFASLASVSLSAQSAAPQQRVVISDGYTSWLLKGDAAANEKYGEGEALPRLLDEGWTIDSVSAGCGDDSRTVYVLLAPNAGKGRR